jgi:hypothetical protein
MQGPDEPHAQTLRKALPASPFGADMEQRRPGYGTLRLQPVMLGPPPDASPGDVTAADDIDPAELRGRPRTGLVSGIMAAMAVLATAGAAYWTLRPTDEDMPAPPRPPAAARPAVEAAPVAATPAAPVPAPVPAAPGVDMANVDADLVPPSTEGLSPARRIRTIRIMVDNDREIAPPPLR